MFLIDLNSFCKKGLTKRNSFRKFKNSDYKMENNKIR